MAFHVACPFTCRKICYCLPGTPSSLRSREAKRLFFQNARRLNAFLANPHILHGGDTTVEVLVPRLSKESKKKKQKVAGARAEGDEGALSNGKKGVTRRKVTSLPAAETSKADQSRKTSDVYKSGASGQLAETDALSKSRSENGQGQVEGVGRLSGTGNGLSWGGHGNARTRRLPSSKFRDMEANARRSGKRNIGRAEGDGESLSAAMSFDAIPEKDGSVKDSRKNSRLNPSYAQLRSTVSTTELDESEALKKRMEAVDADVSAKHELETEGLKPKVPLRLKIRRKNEVDVSRRDREALEEEDTSTVKGHRSKRRLTNIVAKDELGNDNRILQRLGTDAISKRVEVFWPVDNQWYKGTVIGVSTQQAQFSLRYNDGKEETLDFGKERVRLFVF